MNTRTGRLILGLLAFVLLFLITVAVSVPKIENDLTSDVEQQLSVAGITGVAVSFTGRDGTMTGPAVLRDPSLAAVTDRSGIRSLEYASIEAVVLSPTTSEAPPTSVEVTTTVAETTTTVAPTTTAATTTVPPTTAPAVQYVDVTVTSPDRPSRCRAQSPRTLRLKCCATPPPWPSGCRAPSWTSSRSTRRRPPPRDRPGGQWTGGVHQRRRPGAARRQWAAAEPRARRHGRGLQRNRGHLLQPGARRGRQPVRGDGQRDRRPRTELSGRSAALAHGPGRSFRHQLRRRVRGARRTVSGRARFGGGDDQAGARSAGADRRLHRHRRRGRCQPGLEPVSG